MGLISSTARKVALAFGSTVTLWSTCAYNQPIEHHFCTAESITWNCVNTSGTTAISGWSTNAGTGVAGEGEIGVSGKSNSATGVAGLFRNEGGGDIIRAFGNHGQVFRVDKDGNLFVRGQLAGQNGKDGAQGPQGLVEV